MRTAAEIHSERPPFARIGIFVVASYIKCVDLPLAPAIEDVQRLYTKIVSVDLQTTGLVPELLNDIKTILQKYKGKTPVYISFRDPHGKKAVIDAGHGLMVETQDALFDELELLLGENSVKITA